MSADDLLSLDEVWGTAKASILVERKAKAAATIRKIAAEPDRVATQALFLNPENWTRTRGIALLHEDTSTILGNFSEYMHNSIPNCRKLLREEAPITVHATEVVSGSWWLGADRQVEPKQVWHTQQAAIIHVHLAELKVHSPATEVMVFLSYGSIARVELAVDTHFAQEDGQREQLLFLAAGTNILEVMSRDCKITLRQELGL